MGKVVFDSLNKYTTRRTRESLDWLCRPSKFARVFQVAQIQDREKKRRAFKNISNSFFKSTDVPSMIKRHWLHLDFLFSIPQRSKRAKHKNFHFKTKSYNYCTPHVYTAQQLDPEALNVIPNIKNEKIKRKGWEVKNPSPEKCSLSCNKSSRASNSNSNSNPNAWLCTNKAFCTVQSQELDQVARASILATDGYFLVVQTSWNTAIAL